MSKTLGILNRKELIMAYKNKKKNKAHQAEIRKINSYKKRKRIEAERFKEITPMTKYDYLKLMIQQGLI